MRYRVARAAAETLFDDGTGVPVADLDALIVDLHDFLTHARWRTAWAIRAACTVLQFVPFVQGRFRRFTALSSADRAAVLLAVESSGALGKVWVGLKLLLTMLWFDGPGAKSLPEQVRRTTPVDEPLDPWTTRLGPEGPLPAPPSAARVDVPVRLRRRA